MGDTVLSNRFAERFQQVVERLSLAQHRVVVAFSGGLDSTLLLHALHSHTPSLSLVAFHFDHGLNVRSADWATQCASVAASLDVEFVSNKLLLGELQGESLEAVAREARYAALREYIRPGDIVMTAHHADDQLETVLLRVLRGAGVRGLTAIHEAAAFGPGLLARPLLGFTRAEIESEAVRLDLRWIEDPSNDDLRFDRNLLRSRILPPLRERWPQAGLTAARLARLMAETESVLGEVAEAELTVAIDDQRVSIDRLASLSAGRLNNALRYFIRGLDLPVPNAAQLAELTRALGARDDAEAIVSWPGAEARIYRRHLYIHPPRAFVPGKAGRIAIGVPFSFPAGQLRLVPADNYGIPDRWARGGLDIAFRHGGERFRPEGSLHHRTLKQWFQEAGIVPWMRASVPLLFHDDELVAVGDLGLAADLPQGADDGPFWRPEWTGHADLR
jgi:tRNA(Ile)-lysidine synthase